MISKSQSDIVYHDHGIQLYRSSDSDFGKIGNVMINVIAIQKWPNKKEDIPIHTMCIWCIEHVVDQDDHHHML